MPIIVVYISFKRRFVFFHWLKLFQPTFLRFKTFLCCVSTSFSFFLKLLFAFLWYITVKLFNLEVRKIAWISAIDSMAKNMLMTSSEALTKLLLLTFDVALVVQTCVWTQKVVGVESKAFLCVFISYQTPVNFYKWHRINRECGDVLDTVTKPGNFLPCTYFNVSNLSRSFLEKCCANQPVLGMKCSSENIASVERSESVSTFVYA